MKRLAADLTVFALVTVVWWGISAYAVLNALFGPCGMRPDAPCSGGELSFGLAVIGSIVGYAAFLIIFKRARSR